MTGRELLLNSFRNKPVRRRPVSPFIYGNFVKAFHKDLQVDLIQGTIDVYKHFGFELMHRNISVRCDESSLYGPSWQVRVEKKQEGSNTLFTTIIKTPERTLTQFKRVQQLSAYHEVSAIVEHFIKDKGDFEQFVKYQPSVPQLSFPELKRAKLLIKEQGITAPWISGVFNYLADHRKLEDLLMDALTDQGFYQEMADYFMDRLINQVQQVLDEGVDVLSYAGNVANGSIVGPRFFEEHIFCYEKQLIDLIQSAGTVVLYHNCGDARSMIDVYNHLGMEAYESIAEPPYGDNNLKETVSRFDENITLIGNVDQIDFLRKASPEQVRQKSLEILELTKHRPGFVLGTTDFLEDDTPHDNLFALQSVGR